MTALPETPQPTVDAIMAALEHDAAQGEEYLGYGVSASRLGSECDRALWYDLRWAVPAETEPRPGRILRIFARGNAAEDRILNDLRRAGLTVEDVDPTTARQWRFAMADGWIRGKADGIVTGVLEAPKARHVVEIKCIKAADWRAIKKHGLAAKKPEHWHQLHAGMAGLGIDRGIYVAENADTCELLTERLRLDPTMAARQEARVLSLRDAHEAPGRIADKPEAFACRFCDHKAVCHEGAWPRRSCRSCLHFALGSAGNGHCVRFDEPRGPKAQTAGGQCPAHLYLPALVPGEQVDADPTAETVTYRLADGTEWTDGEAEPQPRAVAR